MRALLLSTGTVTDFCFHQFLSVEDIVHLEAWVHCKQTLP